ncbi:PQQ-binding-like beta-propeller repeat protein [Actinomadura sp. 9N215]|uniref:protein kinase domain-containing protein n=1 Tax=Actinomadura sp. 9N215 TaxID=3375150 RepID=UPI0037BE076D
MDPFEPGDPRRVGDYRLLGRLGAGGMGAVFLGRSPGGRTVAVKVIKERYAADAVFRARFRREVSAARKVTGTFTAPILDADPDAAVPWLVTAYLPGLTLREAVGTYGALAAPSARVLAVGLAEALADIHRAGLAHRDLKPGNIMLTADGPRVIDFGIARPEDVTAITKVGAVLGTPGFMSPEQATGGVAGPKSDVFSFGAVLVYAVTGKEPFGGADRAATLRSVADSQADLSGVTDPGLAGLIAACLRREPGERPSSVQLLDMLDRIGADASSDEGAGWLPAPLAEAIDRRVADVRPKGRPWKRPEKAPAGDAGPVVDGVTAEPQDALTAEPADGPEPSPHGREPTPHGREPTPHGREPVPHGREPTPLGREPTPLGREPVPHGREPALGDAATDAPSGTSSGPVAGLSNGAPRVSRRALVVSAPVALAAFGAVALVRGCGNEQPRASTPRSPQGSSSAPPPQGVLRWKSKVSDYYPTVFTAGGVVVSTGQEGKVCALDPQSGRTLWKRNAGLAPHIVGDSVYLRPDTPPWLRAVEAVSGDTRWEASFLEGTAHMAVSGQVLCFGYDGPIRAVGLRDGKVRWVADVPTQKGLAADSGVVAAVSENSVVGLDPRSGRKKWTYRLDLGKFLYVLLVSEGLVFIGDRHGALHAIRADDGTRAWRKERGPSWHNPYSIRSADGVLYADGQQGSVIAMTAATGEERWFRYIDGASTLALSSGTLFAACAQRKTVYALNAADGRILWTYKAQMSIEPVASIAGLVFIGTRGGNVEAAGPPDGGPRAGS